MRGIRRERQALCVPQCHVALHPRAQLRNGHWAYAPANVRELSYAASGVQYSIKGTEQSKSLYGWVHGAFLAQFANASGGTFKLSLLRIVMLWTGLTSLLRCSGHVLRSLARALRVLALEYIGPCLLRARLAWHPPGQTVREWCASSLFALATACGAQRLSASWRQTSLRTR